MNAPGPPPLLLNNSDFERYMFGMAVKTYCGVADVWSGVDAMYSDSYWGN